MRTIVFLIAFLFTLDISAMKSDGVAVTTSDSGKTKSLEKASLAPIFSGFSEICKTSGPDFNVHKFDALFTNNLSIIQTYLNGHSPLEASMNLSDIKIEMSRIVDEVSPTVQKNFDLTQAFLERAFGVLQTKPQHKTLIPMFRQVYTLIARQRPVMMEFAVYSFLSNVNKFKGAECFPGFRNRMIADLLRSIAD